MSEWFTGGFHCGAVPFRIRLHIHSMTDVARTGSAHADTLVYTPR